MDSNPSIFIIRNFELIYYSGFKNKAVNNKSIYRYLSNAYLVIVIAISGCLEKNIEPAVNQIIRFYDQPVRQSSFTDNRDGRTYKTITIDSQTWMAENLAYFPGLNNSKLSGIWVYDVSDTSLQDVKINQDYVRYGCLYNWKTANNFCPANWHLPSTDEWESLLKFVHQNGNPFDEGTALKSKSGWMGGAGGINGNGTDKYGFNALPAGMRIPGGDYYYIGGRTEFWTSTPRDSVYRWAYDMKHTTSSILKYAQAGNYGLSVRCIED